MKAVLLLCFLSIVAGQQFFALRIGDGRAVSLSNGGSPANLKLASFNALDETQQWSFLNLPGYPGSFITSRPYPSLVIDVFDINITAGERLIAWERKTGVNETRNQRWTYDATSGFLSVADYPNLAAGADTSTGIFRLYSTTGPNAPLIIITGSVNAYTIRVMGTNQLTNITFTNAPIPNWIIPAGTPFSERQILAGTILSATNSTGVVLAPSPYTVVSNATITFANPASSCNDVKAHGKTWRLSAIPQLSLQSPDLYQYSVNFCGIASTGCNVDGATSVGCQSGIRSVGRLSATTVSVIPTGLFVRATGGTLDWGCTAYPRTSEYNITCKTDSSSDIVASVWGGCNYIFAIQLPKVYCS